MLLLFIPHDHNYVDVSLRSLNAATINYVIRGKVVNIIMDLADNTRLLETNTLR
jgi:hypothetical protein